MLLVLSAKITIFADIGKFFMAFMQFTNNIGDVKNADFETSPKVPPIGGEVFILHKHSPS